MKTNVLTIILPNVQAMMCGVYKITRRGDVTRLTYTDGTMETTNVSTARWAELQGQDNPFAVVSEVQSRRSALHVYKPLPV